MPKSVLLLLLALSFLSAQQPPPSEPKYQMTTYIVGFLRKGPAWTPEDTPRTREIQEGHMANIRKMGASGKLVVAGPFSDGGDLRGMFIFQNTTEEEARRMAAEDPAVKAGRLVIEWHPWFAGKGLNVNQKQ